MTATAMRQTGAAYDDRHSLEAGIPRPTASPLTATDHAPDGAAYDDRHSGVGRNPEGTPDAPAPSDPADIPLHRFFIRF